MLKTILISVTLLLCVKQVSLKGKESLFNEAGNDILSVDYHKKNRSSIVSIVRSFFHSIEGYLSPKKENNDSDKNLKKKDDKISVSSDMFSMLTYSSKTITLRKTKTYLNPYILIPSPPPELN